ncbi:hypothetical protein HYS47_01595 [Candidatus Woesearchaeota archaeon]|nr:hypothetical protein [Candidatus Woesearchaeota archaeon]
MASVLSVATTSMNSFLFYTRGQTLDIATKAGIPEAMAFFDGGHFIKGIL